MRRWSFSKGHGTENDFVLILDREAMLNIGPDEVRFLCDRRAGIGADGLLRAVLAKHIDGWHGDGSLWFMDYRNADGSIAEMCGNGARVFARFLVEKSLATGPVIPIATRSGLREATLLPDGRVRVAMGSVGVTNGGVLVTPAGGDPLPALTADVGNPHAVSFVNDVDDLVLAPAPRWEPQDAFPDGVNLEFVRRLGPRHVKMRVHERGVGETRSCGTGTVAAAAAAHVCGPDPQSMPAAYRVDVPGGTVEVELTKSQAYLTGPAVLVAHGEVALPEAFSNTGE
ncbi:MAG TPA: diaminopimelate epimerase [Propionibacteriaceae bacterium]|nr:diaminopimelate epimerase [Propionibacteriaceae bacterium]